MTALQALKSRDPEALMASFGSVEEANAFRCEVLPNQLPAECRWFWEQVMTPKQLEQTMNAVRDVCLKVASELDLQPSVHYSLGSCDGLPTLICRPDVARVFYARLPLERHSVLRFYLQITSA